MKKAIAITAAGLALTALVGCSSSNTPAAASDSSAVQPVQKARGEGQQGRPSRQFENEELLSLLKLDNETLQQEFKAGKSLADIASEKGVQEQQVIVLLLKQSERGRAKRFNPGR